VGGILEDCEAVRSEHRALERCVSVEPRRRADQEAEVRLLFSDRTWLRSQAGTALVTALDRHPSVLAARRHRAAIVLRVDDAVLARLEQHIALGETVGMQSSDMPCLVTSEPGPAALPTLRHAMRSLGFLFGGRQVVESAPGASEPMPGFAGGGGRLYLRP
jgi:hypothetical protein